MEKIGNINCLEQFSTLELLKELEKREHLNLKAHYEDLINGRVKPITIREKIISKAKDDPEKVLAQIGLTHPASEVVFSYFERKNNNRVPNHILHRKS